MNATPDNTALQPQAAAQPDADAQAAESAAAAAYDRALRRVMGLADFERSKHSPGHSAFHLERMGMLMDKLGSPHLAAPAAHIAGTKGKGSVSAMLASILGAAGLTTGLYSSPHLHSATERIRVGMRPVSRQRFADAADAVWDAVTDVGQNGGYGGVTTFEAMTAMAFIHFKRVRADFQVIEVGLGGRLDATNVVCPQVCAITSISLDHTATLGSTIAKIAYEKAGIIKPGVPVVVAPQRPEAMEVIASVAAARGAALISVAERMAWRRRGADARGQAFDLDGLRGPYALETALLGDYQMENAAAAVAVAETLADQGVGVSAAHIAQGIRNARWPARLQTLAAPDGGSGLLVVDGAHNPYSMRLLTDALRDHFDFDRLIAVFGALGGHSAAGMLRALAPLSPVIVAARSRHPRAAASADIAAAARELGLDAPFSADDVGEALRHALDIARPGDMTLGTGSLSVAAEIIEAAQGIPPETYPYLKGVSR